VLRAIQMAVRQVLEIVKAATTINQVTKLQENETGEWIETDKGVYVTGTTTTHDTNH
jgi:hypothetical protein